MGNQTERGLIGLFTLLKLPLQVWSILCGGDDDDGGGGDDDDDDGDGGGGYDDDGDDDDDDGGYLGVWSDTSFDGRDLFPHLFVFELHMKESLSWLCRDSFHFSC